MLSVVEEASGHMKTIGDHEFPEDVVAGEQWRPPTSEGREAWASAQEEAFLKEQAAQTKKASPMEAARLRFASMRGGGPKKA